MIKETMDKFGTIKLVYDIPWYWKISYTIQNKKYITTRDMDTTTKTEHNNICDVDGDGDDGDETKKAAITAATMAATMAATIPQSIQ